MGENSLSSGERDKKVVLRVDCIVKGYHDCQFNTYVGEEFVASKKLKQKGKAFHVTNVRGQLGHLQIEVVNALWT